jgi:hypothetical protein
MALAHVDPTTKEEAIAALRSGAWAETCGHSGCQDHAGGKWRIHSIAGGIGADWDLDEAEAAVQRSTEVGWSDHLLRHDLIVLVDGRIYRFDVRRPVPDASVA